MSGGRQRTLGGGGQHVLDYLKRMQAENPAFYYAVQSDSAHSSGNIFWDFEEENPMFYRSRIEHSLRLPPHLLSLPLKDAVKGELEKLFLDKVIANLGLCISVYDIHSIRDCFILPNDGHPTLKVVFTLIMFRPFVDEIIIAKVIESTAQGLRLSLGFFDDIYVPDDRFPKQCYHKEKNNTVTWFWKPSDEDLFIDLKDKVRFQVISVDFPKIPINQQEKSEPFAPMKITGSIDFDGLGPVDWWQDVEDEPS